MIIEIRTIHIEITIRFVNNSEYKKDIKTFICVTDIVTDIFGKEGTEMAEIMPWQICL